MAFDIHESIFNRDGEFLEKKARRYQEQLLQLYSESPEGQTIEEEGIRPGHWASIVIEFGIEYVGVTPPRISPAILREILFDIIPRKLSTVPEAASEIIRDLQFFWKFLQREFHLENAAACLEVLDDKAAHKLEEELSNPANFGLAKSMMMMGLERGFDMTTQEGVDAWMETYNTELAAGTIEPFSLPFPFSAFPGQQTKGIGRTQNKTKRRTARSSRKRNRNKK